MKKKVEFDLILGFFLLIFGVFSAAYAIITVILSILLAHTGFFIYVKDIVFDLVFILLGLIFIRKKKKKNYHSKEIIRKVY